MASLRVSLTTKVNKLDNRARNDDSAHCSISLDNLFGFLFAGCAHCINCRFCTCDCCDNTSLQTYKTSLLLFGCGVALLLGLIIIYQLAEGYRVTLFLPVFVNLSLLGVFVSSLQTNTSIIERFARMQVDDLSTEEQRYCRQVTRIWCVFFVVNGGIALILAIFSSVFWWSLYTGVLSYLLIGLLFSVEYTYRKYRFGRYDSHVLDRVLSNYFLRAEVRQPKPNGSGSNNA